jgi:hypothetical protein
MDERTALPYGRVSRTRAGAGLGIKLDGVTRLNLTAEAGTYSGLRLPDNPWRQASLTFSRDFTPLESGDLAAGLEVFAFGFDKQLDGFEVGEGGYFSPSLYAAGRLVGMYSGLDEEQKLSYRARLALGGQYTAGNTTEYMTPGLWASVTFEFKLAYTFSPGLELGIQYVFDNVGVDYKRNSGLIYLEQRFVRRPKTRR